MNIHLPRPGDDESGALAGLIVLLLLLLFGFMSCGPAPISGLGGYTLVDDNQAVSPSGDTIVLTSIQKLEYNTRFLPPGTEL